MEKQVEIRREHNMTKENEATEEPTGWKGLKHFEHKYDTYSTSLVEQVFGKGERGFFCSN